MYAKFKYFEMFTHSFSFHTQKKKNKMKGWVLQSERGTIPLWDKLPILWGIGQWGIWDDAMGHGKWRMGKGVGQWEMWHW